MSMSNRTKKVVRGTIKKPTDYGFQVITPWFREHQKTEAREKLISEALRKGRMSLYVHIPFCKSKCAYCAYVSRTPTTDLVDSYFEALKNEIQLFGSLSNVQVTSIYFGGGTPTLIPTKLLETMAFVRSRFSVKEGAEITVETHPKTVNTRLLSSLKKAGVNRLSMGVQSFSNEILKAMNRGHTAEEAIDAAQKIRAAGFQRFNIDLIYAYPKQDIEIWMKTLEQAVVLCPTEITTYRVRLGNRGGKTPLRLQYETSPEDFPDEALVSKMETSTRKILGKNGYSESPVGWFIKEGVCEPQMCIDRWRDQVPLIGFGPGAYSMGQLSQYQNTSNILEYVERADPSNPTALIEKGMVLTKTEAEAARDWKKKKFSDNE